MIAEGTAANPIVFTSTEDDSWGGGTFETTSDGASTGTAGQWSGIVLDPTSQANLDHVVISYGGGLTPVGGTLDNYNAIQDVQAQLRIADSTIKNNSWRSGDDVAVLTGGG